MRTALQMNAMVVCEMFSNREVPELLFDGKHAGAVLTQSRNYCQVAMQCEQGIKHEAKKGGGGEDAVGTHVAHGCILLLRPMRRGWCTPDSKAIHSPCAAGLHRSAA